MSEDSDNKSDDQLQLVVCRPQWCSRGSFINLIVIVSEFVFKTPELTEANCKTE